MKMNEYYQAAGARYAALGVNTEAAMEALARVPVSIHCWQGDDVTGFENSGEALSGGIQATGNYPGKARTFAELTADFDKACSLIPGRKRINLHASYAVFPPGDKADRDALAPRHFAAWVEYAKSRNIGIDFNPTFFSHPMVKNGMTLASPNEAVRAFWIRHGQACRRIAAYFAKELNTYCLCNVWIPDGLKDVPADRLGPRLRLEDSLNQIFAEKLPGVIDSVESKVFGIGVEAYTVGSHEFYLGYAVAHPGIYALLDSGHFHPTEAIADKIPAMLCRFDRLALHLTRPVHWDSDHVLRFDDDLREITCELVRCDALQKALIGLDFFDASINRVAAWVIGTRNLQKALLYALLMPHAQLARMQDEARFTELMTAQEAYKTLPFGTVWDAYCQRQSVPADGEWYPHIEQYEQTVLKARNPA
ncbi:MAG: L-rhamnose isomerase [Eubacteriales bacterium]|nr:L-rhamnose isomerase [Eubacteriales bacterium]